MMRQSRRLQFEGAVPEGAIRLLSDRIDSTVLSDSNRTVTVNLARVMSFKDHFYGKVDLTRKMFSSMIKNFGSNVYGQEIFIDVAHNPSDGAAAQIKNLRMQGLNFMADAEFTDYGIDAVKKRGFKYLSIDFTDNYTDPETENEHGPLLFGAGLTIRPRVKHLHPVTLSFDDDEDKPMLLSLHARHLLTEETRDMFEKLWKQLQEKLEALKLGERVISQYKTQLETTAKVLGDNEEALQVVVDSFASTAKQLAESSQGTNDSITLDFSGLSIPTPAAGFGADDVRKLLAEEKENEAKAAKQLQEGRDANIKLFGDTLAAAEGLTEDIRTQLSAGVEGLITAELSSDQVVALAESQIKLGNDMAAQAHLAGMGYKGARGAVHASVEDRNTAKSLQEHINNKLKLSDEFMNKKLFLTESENNFVKMVLSEFDRMNARAIHEENKMLAGGTTGIADTAFPVGVQRTVIREALSDLRVLELVQTLTDFGAQLTTQIPYEKRDMSAVYNSGVVYEGQGIHRASVTQAMDSAYIVPMKLAFLISDEVAYFSRSSQINWDAYARNVASNARVVRELIVRRICNELQRSADSFQATAVTTEGFDGQLDGSTVNTIKTTSYPIVRPHQVRDIKGAAVGSPTNPITVRLDGSAISEYDGTGDQSAGTYYRITNYNLGYVQFVNQLGAAVTPANAAGADNIDYSYATNIVKFDLDVPGTTTKEKHYNGLLQAIGARKAMLADDRFISPNFQLMSNTMNDTATNAEQHTAAGSKSGTSLSGEGDLETVKGVPAFSTNAPAVDLGDERILMGERGTLSYTVAKPFETEAPFNAVDSNGKPTGEKQAYGTEFSSIKVPDEIRQRLTSVIAYSFTGR